MISVEKLENFITEKINGLSSIEEKAFIEFSFHLSQKILALAIKHKSIHNVEAKTNMFPLKGKDLTLEDFIAISANIANRFEKLGYVVSFKNRENEEHEINYYIQNHQWLNEIIIKIK